MISVTHVASRHQLSLKMIDLLFLQIADSVNASSGLFESVY